MVTITGGSRGIGDAMSLAFAECGAKVAVASRKIDSCEDTVKEIRSSAATAPRTPCMSANGKTAIACARKFTPSGVAATC